MRDEKFDRIRPENAEWLAYRVGLYVFHLIQRLHDLYGDEFVNDVLREIDGRILDYKSRGLTGYESMAEGRHVDSIQRSMADVR